MVILHGKAVTVRHSVRFVSFLRTSETIRALALWATSTIPDDSTVGIGAATLDPRLFWMPVALNLDTTASMPPTGLIFLRIRSLLSLCAA